MIGITLEGALGIGGRVTFASFPENYYRNTGEKVIDLDHTWVFDHNPFVVRDQRPSEIINLWALRWPQLLRNFPLNSFLEKPVFGSIADRTASIFNHVAYLRHPRLYRYEDVPVLRDRIVLHTTGNVFNSAMGEDRRKVMSEEIVDYIRTKYRNFELIQIGLKEDLDARVIDCRGIENIWETVKIIAQAGTFIGIDSGPSWIAASYPHIFRKKVLMQYPPEFLRNCFIAMHVLIPHHHWFDASFMYFNRSTDDAGITYSYLKI